MYYRGKRLSAEAIAEIKDTPVNAIGNEAIDHWLNESEQKQIVEKFNLDRLDEVRPTEDMTRREIEERPSLNKSIDV